MMYALTVSRPDKMSGEELLELGFEVDEDGCLDQFGAGEGFVLICTLEDLQAFVAKWGKVILYENSIEIYNGYRE